MKKWCCCMCKPSGCRGYRRRSASQSRCCHTDSATSHSALVLQKSLMCPQLFDYIIRERVLLKKRSPISWATKSPCLLCTQSCHPGRSKFLLSLLVTRPAHPVIS